MPIEQQETQLAPAMHQREEMIEQLEKLNLKVKGEKFNITNILEIKVMYNFLLSIYFMLTIGY